MKIFEVNVVTKVKRDGKETWTGKPGAGRGGGTLGSVEGPGLRGGPGRPPKTEKRKKKRRRKRNKRKKEEKKILTDWGKK